MNINTTGLLIDEPDLAVGDCPTETLAESIDEHQEILASSDRGWVFTGEVCLVSPPEPDLARTGALQVWSKTEDGVWVHVTPDGVAVEAGCPLGD